MDWEKGGESENVEDRRGVSPRKIAVGGGVGVLIITLIGLYFGVDPQKLNQFLNNNAPGVGQGGGNGQVDNGSQPAAEDRIHKFTSTILHFTEEVWDDEFHKIGKTYERPHMVLFSDQVETGGCGVAPSAVGPFYCPGDKTVYLDPTFFEELAQKLGGSNADFSQAYVIAHEVGHHVQNLLGYSKIVDDKRRTLPKEEFNKWSVRLELQADYLAGVWAYHGQEKFHFIQDGDVESAIQSANAIGDDRLQKRARGFVSPESFTHGTSAQRVKWFRRGLQTGDLSKMKEIFTSRYEDL